MAWLSLTWFYACLRQQSHTQIRNLGKISAQPHTIVKQICFPNSNVLFLSLFSLSKNWMYNVVWGCAEILPRNLFQTTGFRCLPLRNCFLFPFLFVNSHAWFTRPHSYSVTYVRKKDTTPSFISRGLSSRIQSLNWMLN